MREKRCAKCKARPQEGHFLDQGYGAIHSPKWQPGPPKKGWLGSLKVDKKTTREVQAWRCERCGFLEHYAV